MLTARPRSRAESRKQQADGMILITPRYYEGDPARAKELTTAYERNRACRWIDKIIQVDGWPTYRDLIATAEPCKIHIVANSDVWFDDSLGRLQNHDLRGKLLALGDEAHRQYAWIFRAPLWDFYRDFKLGLPACEGRFAYEAHKAGMHVFNPILSIHAHHQHVSPVHHWTIADWIEGPRLDVFPCSLENPTPKRYSQGDEENFILDFFKQNPPRYKRFCDVGAYDGIGHSNTRALWLEDWRGVFFEPNPQTFLNLRQNIRLNVDTVECRAVATDKLFIPVPSHVVIRGLLEDAELATAREEIAPWNAHIQEWREIEVGTALLSDYLPACPVDFLSIDAEGLTCEALETMGEARPTLIMAEWNGIEADYHRMHSFLEPLGYIDAGYRNERNATWRLK